MRELRTDELQPGMIVKLKSRAGTLPQNHWFTIDSIRELPRKQYAPLGSVADSPATNRRPFAARTMWLVQDDATTPMTPAQIIAKEQRELVDAMVRKGHARYINA